MMDLIGIKTPRGLYLSDNIGDDRYHRTSPVGFLVNGAEVQRTFHKDWGLAEGMESVKTFSRMAKRPNTNFRFELIDESLASDKIPLVIPRDEAGKLVSYEFHWYDHLQHLASLYRQESDPCPDIEKQVPFTLEIVLELGEDLIDYESFSYPRPKNRLGDAQRHVTNQSATYRDLDRIIFPSLLLPSRPCRLTSQESYDLVRSHVKKHFHPKVATITSDYNFCFTVKRGIRLDKPYSYKEEIKNARGKSYKKRKYREVFVNSRSVVVFEMTHDSTGRGKGSGGYGGYTVLRGFEGENERDLHENIEVYLAELMETINAPLTDCPHCNGMGVIEPQATN